MRDRLNPRRRSRWQQSQAHMKDMEIMKDMKKNLSK